MILYRYIIKEHIFPFFASLSIIVFLFLMQWAVILLDRIISKGLDPGIVLEIFVIQLGWIIALATPMAILTATLMTFGRMAGDNEITAIKASGRSMWPLLVPVFSAAAVFTVSLVYFNNLVLPDANHRAANLFSDISRKRPAAFIEPGILIQDFSNYTLFTQRVNPHTGQLFDVKIWSDAPDKDPSTTVAASGFIRLTPDERFLELTLFDGETHSTSRQDPKSFFTGRFKKQIIYIQNVDSRLQRTNSSYRSDREESSEVMLANAKDLKRSLSQILSEFNVSLDTLSSRIGRLDSLSKADFSLDAKPVQTSQLVSSLEKNPLQNFTIGENTAHTAITRPIADQKSADRPTRKTKLFLSAVSPAPAGPVTRETSGKTPAESLTFAQWARPMIPAVSKARYEIQRAAESADRIQRRATANEMMIASYMVEVHKKFAIPIACLIFVLIGAPLGIMARRGGLTTGASYSIFFFIAYWAFLIGGEDMADKLKISPEVAMWSGNVVIGLCGVVLTILMLRETTIRFDSIVYGWNKFAKWNKGKIHYITDNAFYKLLVLPAQLMRLPSFLVRKSIRILPTYLIRMFAGYVVGILVAMIVIFFVIDYISNLHRFENATWVQVFIYYYYYLPWIVEEVFPLVLLLASMFAIGRLAKYSELTSMKSAGINIRQLTFPLLFCGILLSGATFYLGEMIIPKANALRNQLADQLSQPRGSSARAPAPSTTKEFRRNFYYFGDRKTVYNFEEFTTQPQMAKNVRRETFEKTRITQRVRADAMVYDSSGWKFFKGTLRNFSSDSSKVLNFDTLKDTILRVTPANMVVRLKSKEEMSYWELNSYVDLARRRGEDVQKYAAELDFKIALPMMNFIVILLGIAITARTGRKGSPVLFGIGLLLAFSYWMIARFAIVFAENGHLSPAVGAWSANVLFLAIALVLYRKASR